MQAVKMASMLPGVLCLQPAQIEHDHHEVGFGSPKYYQHIRNRFQPLRDLIALGVITMMLDLDVVPATDVLDVAVQDHADHVFKGKQCTNDKDLRSRPPNIVCQGDPADYKPCRKLFSKLVAGVCLYRPAPLTVRLVDLAMVTSERVLDQWGLTAAAEALTDTCNFTFGFWGLTEYRKSEPYGDMMDQYIAAPLEIAPEVRLIHLMGMTGSNAAQRKIYLLR